MGIKFGLPEDITDSMTMSGNVYECIGKIEDYVMAGVNQ